MLCAISGFPALAGRRGSAVTAALIVTGALAGLAGCALGLAGPPTVVLLPWQIPGGAFHLRVDALAAFFAAPVFLLAGVGGIYAERYWPISRSGARPVRLFFGIMVSALVLMIAAANTILFIAAWEMVALTAFFLVATEHDQPEARRAAWIYLASSHVATLALFGAVVLMHAATGTWDFARIPAGAASAILWLALIAFGFKAGLMPFHIWLPGAHAAAPSHVSAVLSGVVIKMGIYGLVRVLSLTEVVPPSFSITLLVAGIASSVLGVAFALAQHDLKRLLAYHSIENIGIIVTGLGIALVAQRYGMTGVAALGFAGALLHVWNHGLFKALLFLSGGAAVHETHTREIDRMGGLARTMPATAVAFVIGAAAIVGLPPLNGFVSEWLLYLAGFGSITRSNPAAPALLLMLVVPALALTGALALACFVKAFGAVFLGSPRTPQAAAASEVPRSMLLAMAPLIAGCAAIGLFPAAVGPLLGRVVRVAEPHLPYPVNFADLLLPVQFASIAVAVICAAAVLLLVAVTRGARRTVTWDCGYDKPSARMQYTSSSFARGLVSFFAWILPPVVHAPHEFSLFPSGAAFESHVPDTVLDRAVLPIVRGGRRLLGFARFIQSGRVQLYLLYIGATLIALLAWSAR